MVRPTKTTLAPTSLPFGPDVSQRHWWRPARARFATGLDPFDAAGPDLRLAEPPVGPSGWPPGTGDSCRSDRRTTRPRSGSASAGRIEGWGAPLFSAPAASRTVSEPAPVGH